MKKILASLLCGLTIFINSVVAQTIPGTLATSATVCANNNSGVINLTNYTGNVLRWEYSVNGSSLWTTISNTSASYNYLNLSQTTYFRVIVQNPGYTALSSNTVVIRTQPGSVGGAASVLSSSLCVGNSVKLNVAGHTGSITAWQYSTNNASTWNTITSSSDSVTKYIHNQTTPTLYRVQVKSGVCPATVSDSVLVSLSPVTVGGTVSGSTTVCSGANNNTLSVSGNVGNVIRWESSLTGSNPWTSINQSTNSLAYTNLINSTYFRAVSKSGTCNEMASAPAVIHVNSTSAGGFISGTQHVCSQVNSGVLNVNGHNGNIVQWEYSLNNGQGWNATAVNTSTYQFSNLTQNTLYKVQVLNGVCPAAYSQTFFVSVDPLPPVNFTVTAGCQGSSLQFTNTTTGSNSYSWDFKDGSGTNITNPLHYYAAAGNYLVKLTATSISGCTDSISKLVIVYPKPNVGFTSLDSVCGFNQVPFVNNSSIASGLISAYSWSFGDNTANSILTNPTHTYTLANTYTVKLVATSNNSCSDSLVKLIEVFPKPNANFTAANVCKKTAASFINTSYIQGGGITHHWDFGDSQTSSILSPTHQYSLAGNYNVKLITQSNHGCKDTIIKPIYINEQPDLTMDVANVCLSKISAFAQTITPAVPHYTLQWDFGNGHTTIGNSPQYTYFAAGNYQTHASLVTDSNCVSHSSKITSVYPLPNVLFNFSNVCSADSASMNNYSSISSGSLSYAWDFGNAVTSSLQNPRVLYQNAADYNIQLIVSSNYGCVDSLRKTISIYDAPTANFTFDNVCDGEPVQFNNTSTVLSGVIKSNLWNFGDNTNSTLTNPSKQYLQFGSYAVTLQTSSSNGCHSSITRSVNVYQAAIANFSFTNQCFRTAIPFTNLTILSNETYDSEWRFGDSTSSTFNSPSHLYQHAGSKEVFLKVITQQGCVDSIAKFVQTYAWPVIFAGKDTSIAKGFGVQLNATGATHYAWLPSDGLNNPTKSNPIANPVETSTYVVQGTDDNGCFNSDTLTITVDDDFLVVPYNLLTPNGNGKNDLWYVKNIESYPNNHVAIMNEWGVVVFEKNGYANSWDGRNMRGEILPDGTYYYIITFDGVSKVYKGFITLLRNKP